MRTGPKTRRIVTLVLKNSVEQQNARCGEGGTPKAMRLGDAECAVIVRPRSQHGCGTNEQTHKLAPKHSGWACERLSDVVDLESGIHLENNELIARVARRARCTRIIGLRSSSGRVLSMLQPLARL